MASIYRLRPSNDFLLDELKESYLWFSKPTAYNDKLDANVTSFRDNNMSISESFERIYKESNDVLEKAKHIGICCFTEDLPDSNIWKIFPGGRSGVFIEYDKEVLQAHFVEKFQIGDCFKKVEYHNDPTTFLFFKEGSDILWRIDEEGGLHYKSLKEIEKDDKLRDELFLKMFTMISSKFSEQNESRIIIGGHNISIYDDNVKGYKIPIPPKAILRIHPHPDVPVEVKEQLLNYYKDKVIV